MKKVLVVLVLTLSFIAKAQVRNSENKGVRIINKKDLSEQITLSCVNNMCEEIYVDSEFINFPDRLMHVDLNSKHTSDYCRSRDYHNSNATGAPCFGVTRSLFDKKTDDSAFPVQVIFAPVAIAVDVVSTPFLALIRLFEDSDSSQRESISASTKAVKYALDKVKLGDSETIVSRRVFNKIVKKIRAAMNSSH